MLETSARRHGIHRLHSWNRAALEATPFYREHREILDLPRGSGYWLWKPYLIRRTLEDLADRDVLVYCDAGIEIIADLSPLFALCRASSGVLLFAGHYEHAGTPGPNTLRKWTKRDCFVALGCDDPSFHDATMADASLLVLERTPATLELVDAWLRWCEHAQLVTDAPSTCGLPELPDFVEHRHDQSILSLLAHQRKLELRRHPSQMGNHVKEPTWRERGEWTRLPYGASPIHTGSPYGTLVDHHRGSRSFWTVRRWLRPLLGPVRRWLRFKQRGS